MNEYLHEIKLNVTVFSKNMMCCDNILT